MKNKKTKHLEEAFEIGLLDKFPDLIWEREVALIQGRRFKHDFVNYKFKIAVEINGGIWMPKGGHSSGIGIQKDYEKLNLTLIAGYYPFMFSAKDVKSGYGLQLLQDFIQTRMNDAT